MLRYLWPVVLVCAATYGFSIRSAVPLRVQDVRFVPAPQFDGAPSTFLKFGLVNESPHDLVHIVVNVLIQSHSGRSHHGARIAGPFALAGNNVVLHPGETLDFALRLRNLASNCTCVAHVTVLSAESGRDNGESPADGSPLSPEDPAPSTVSPAHAMKIVAAPSLGRRFVRFGAVLFNPVARV
jgi:hypothetical protein